MAKPMIGGKQARSLGLYYIYILIIAALLVIFTAAPARATPLDLTLLDFPDIVSGFIDVTYDAGTDAFKARGFALELDDDGIGSALPIVDGTFDLSSTIDDVGTLIAGTATYGGTVASLGFNSGTLLTGNLTAFGFRDAGGDPLEFLFEVTGGDAADLFGSSAGLILSDTNFGGSFAADFDNLIAGVPGTGSAVSNVAPVPEPTLMLLIGSGLIGLAGLRKKLMK